MYLCINFATQIWPLIFERTTIILQSNLFCGVLKIIPYHTEQQLSFARFQYPDLEFDKKNLTIFDQQKPANYVTSLSPQIRFLDMNKSGPCQNSQNTIKLGFIIE